MSHERIAILPEIGKIDKEMIFHVSIIQRYTLSA